MGDGYLEEQLSLRFRQWSMIVAMAVVRMVEVPFDEVVRVIAVRDRFMTAVGPMNVAAFMRAAIVLGGAAVRILFVHIQHVFIGMIPVHVVQMPVMEIIGVIVVNDRHMTAIGTMHMVVTGVFFTFAHKTLSFVWCPSRRPVELLGNLGEGAGRVNGDPELVSNSRFRRVSCSVSTL
jgi:hypothetical protein